MGYTTIYMLAVATALFSIIVGVQGAHFPRTIVFSTDSNTDCSILNNTRYCGHGHPIGSFSGISPRATKWPSTKKRGHYRGKWYSPDTQQRSLTRQHVTGTNTCAIIDDYIICSDGGVYPATFGKCCPQGVFLERERERERNHTKQIYRC
jgi:hypothetical protein